MDKMDREMMGGTMTAKAKAAKRQYDPLKYAPSKAEKRYSSLVKAAKTGYRASCKLFCVECNGWDYQASKACLTNHCPLWSANQRIFK
jgi:hypothetical protein